MITDAVFQQRIGESPHTTQEEVIKCFNENASKEIVLCCGRRWGKSWIAGYLAAKVFSQGLSDIAEGKRESVKIWIVSPSYELSKKVFEYIVRFLRKIDKRIDQSISDRPFPQIKLSESVWIQCKSADNPTSLLGEELDLLIIDEAANIPNRIWFDYLMPTTISKMRDCKTIFISTPRGNNWFHDVWLKNKENGSSFHFTSLDGVNTTQETWNRLKEVNPTAFFKQNYEAAFLDGADTVFRGVKNIIRAECLVEKINEPHIVGIDLAQVNDYTVLTVVGKISHKVRFIDRFNRIPYPLQIKRIIETIRKYGAKPIIDSNNIGLAICDELRAQGIQPFDFKISGTVSQDQEKKGSKEELIEKLSLDIENRNIFIPPDDTLIDELESYAYNMTDFGRKRYSAPDGMHDDMVISLALANWGLMGKTKQENVEASRSMPAKNKSFQYK
jgi:hypothetical protein